MDIDAPSRGMAGKWFLIALLLLLLVVGVVAGTGSLNLAGSQSRSNECPFQAQQEAFRLAQETARVRLATPFRGNYGTGSATICFQNGSNYFYPAEVYQGRNSSIVSGYPAQKAHSEAFAYDELYGILASVSFDRNQLVRIYVVIFSQVIVCPACQKEMRLWQRELRNELKINLVFLSIWQLRYGRGFDPHQFPTGTGTPVTINDVEKVPIDFVL